ncbi:MAG: SGNH/GDSL hydrolase family protein [Thiohalocapsa sp.]|uniref:SGNH/GDSL hydrolase family protein n=1 Tax=Thiohalocapsa sp. TaxID=2497641 RepID=UPI0025FD59DA|nr:SGNH/GDSL hydrolase family protein [Thiohalocapsa sp.]MCG6942064.1 SGNH/GDSL hydrolase family protein [Thiohalocapsa sp.]
MPHRLRLTLLSLLLLPGVVLAGRMPYSNLYIFGDSLSDIGNSYLATTADGQDPPSPDPTYYPLPGHFLNDAGNDGIGDSYGEVMWRALNLPGELAPGLAGGTDYAVGGARSRYGEADMTGAVGSRVPPALADMPSRDAASAGSLWGQLNAYLPTSASVADADALYIVMIGGNDVRDIATLQNLGSAEATGLFTQSVGDVVAGILELIGAGARNVVVPTVPDLGLTPEALAFDAASPGVSAALSSLTTAYNDAVVSTLNAQLAALTGVDDLNLWYLDTFDRLQDIVEDPARFGLANVTDACLTGYFVETDTDPTGDPSLCSNPESYAFYDRVHPTSTVHAILADDFLAAVPAPATAVLMLGALPGLAMKRRRRR